MKDLTREQIILINKKSLKTMRKHKYNKREIAKMCGVTPTLINDRLKEYNIR